LTAAKGLIKHRDIAASHFVRAAVKLPESTGKVALQGYCLGALMAFYYGRSP